MYDSLNQLTRENNQAEGYTYVYTYENGNILTRKKYAYTTGTLGAVEETQSWTYGDTSWGDLLTAYNDGTSTYTVTSDASGNVTGISNGTDSVTHTWLARTLQSATVVEDGTTTTATYSYNADGQRIKKVVGSTTTNYYYNGDILAGMTIGSNKLIFMYDESGSPFGFTYNGTAYYYVKNLQGDVEAIANSSGTIVVRYYYDAWGNILDISGTLADTVGEANPIRYRSYYYDTETGYYYLNSRYYDPELCRFISADGYVSTGQGVLGFNMFVYCLNNPINYIDPSGCAPDNFNDFLDSMRYDAFFGNPFGIGVGTTMNGLPRTGPPNSSRVLKNPDGTIKQKRWYGPDGNAIRDRDYNHGGSMDFPHDHEWLDGKRQEDHLPPSPDYQFSWDPVLGAGIVVVCFIGITIIAADNITGAGIADDFLLVPLGRGVAEGMKMMFR